MDMPFGIFNIYGVLKLPEFLAYDWLIFSCLKPLVTKLEALCGDMTGPFLWIFKAFYEQYIAKENCRFVTF